MRALEGSRLEAVRGASTLMTGCRCFLIADLSNLPPMRVTVEESPVIHRIPWNPRLILLTLSQALFRLKHY
jgi:hypothetical protein